MSVSTSTRSPSWSGTRAATGGDPVHLGAIGTRQCDIDAEVTGSVFFTGRCRMSTSPLHAAALGRRPPTHEDLTPAVISTLSFTCGGPSDRRERGQRQVKRL